MMNWREQRLPENVARLLPMTEREGQANPSALQFPQRGFLPNSPALALSVKARSLFPRGQCHCRVAEETAAAEGAPR